MKKPARVVVQAKQSSRWYLWILGICVIVGGVIVISFGVFGNNSPVTELATPSKHIAWRDQSARLKAINEARPVHHRILPAMRRVTGANQYAQHLIKMFALGARGAEVVGPVKHKDPGKVRDRVVMQVDGFLVYTDWRFWVVVSDDPPSNTLGEVRFFTRGGKALSKPILYIHRGWPMTDVWMGFVVLHELVHLDDMLFSKSPLSHQKKEDTLVSEVHAWDLMISLMDAYTNGELGRLVRASPTYSKLVFDRCDALFPKAMSLREKTTRAGAYHLAMEFIRINDSSLSLLEKVKHKIEVYRKTETEKAPFYID